MSAPQPAGPLDNDQYPGENTIVVTAPVGRYLCNSLNHYLAGTPADVLVTFGTLGHGLDQLWRECTGRTYALCDACWERTRKIAELYCPVLVITDSTKPAPEIPGAVVPPAQSG